MFARYFLDHMVEIILDIQPEFVVLIRWKEMPIANSRHGSVCYISDSFGTHLAGVRVIGQRARGEGDARDAADCKCQILSGWHIDNDEFENTVFRASMEHTQ